MSSIEVHVAPEEFAKGVMRFAASCISFSEAYISSPTWVPWVFWRPSGASPRSVPCPTIIPLRVSVLGLDLRVPGGSGLEGSALWINLAPISVSGSRTTSRAGAHSHHSADHRTTTHDGQKDDPEEGARKAREKKGALKLRSSIPNHRRRGSRPRAPTFSRSPPPEVQRHPNHSIAPSARPRLTTRPYFSQSLHPQRKKGQEAEEGQEG